MNILERFSKLYHDKRELALLEWTYLIMAVAAVLIAGIIALFDQAAGLSVLIVPMVAFVAMSMNVVAWALIKLAADSFLGKKAGGKSGAGDKKKK